jgi:superfamily II DNA or RNA helicase
MTRYLYRSRHPDVAYVDASLWLPKRHIHVEAIQNALEFFDVTRTGPKKYRMWRETRDHLTCPREFVPRQNYGKYPFPFVIDRPTEFEKTGLAFRRPFEYRDSRQEKSYQALRQADGGVFNCGAGRGKTVMITKKMIDVGGPALVITHLAGLVDQWRRSLLWFTNLSDSDIGIIKEDRFEWDRPVVLAMIQTLSRRAVSGDLPAGFSRRFALTDYDECHHLAAPFFLPTASLCEGERIGTTATDLRSDGLEFMYHYHIGAAFYRDKEIDCPPTGYFHSTRVEASKEELERAQERFKDDLGRWDKRVSISKLRGVLAENPEFIRSRELLLRELLSRGRKIIALSHSKKLLRILHERFSGSVCITQEVEYQERLPLMRQSQLCLIVAQLGTEALDDVRLDAGVALYPFSSEVWLEQFVGRIGRLNLDDPEKKAEFHILEDEKIEDFANACQKMRKWFRKQQYPFFLREAPR